MASSVLTVTIRFRWWLLPYLHTVIFFCKLFNCEPNYDRLHYWVERGIKIVDSR